jgi:hypothetical protein
MAMLPPLFVAPGASLLRKSARGACRARSGAHAAGASPRSKAGIERLFSRHVSVDEARTIGDALARAVKAARQP